MNEKLQISIQEGKAYAHSLSKIVKTPADGSVEDRYLHASQTDAVRQQLFNPNDSWFGSNWGKVVTLLHFSDIHGDAIELARIVDYHNTLPSSVVPLFTGDMVRYDWADGIEFWENINGTDKILVAIGNHDAQSGKTATDCYNRYLAPNIASWGATYQSNLCYYYKDWALLNVRLIVLDCMHWDATQQSWLVATLASAKTAGYHVVVANHYATADAPINRACSFDTPHSGVWDKINSAAPNAVQDFIDGGGHFVAWLCGHTHADMLRFPANYPQQLYYAIANASTPTNGGQTATCQLERINGKKSQDLFNLVTINPVQEIMSIVRVGADHDTLGRHIGSVVYDYANHQILWND